MDEPSAVVVVGAGASGCLLAARLAAAGRDVTLVEAGPDLRGQEPAELRDGWGFSRDHAWGYASEPDSAGDSAAVLRTRLVGGTAWLTRFALRNHPADFDEWNRHVGGGWGFADVVEAFNAVERDLEHDSDPWHGADGPIPVTRYPGVEPTEFETATRAALQGEGLPWVPDLNHPGATGFGRMPMSSMAGRRYTTVDLLDESPGNLEVLADTLVADVVLEGHRATGVRLVDGSTLPAGQVVLAAGVYGSPCLLMRSGIGPVDLLTDLGIEVRRALPGVGENLCDHPAVSVDTGYRGVQRPGPVLHTLATFNSTDSAASSASAVAPDLALWAGDPEGDPAEGWFDVVLWRPRARGRVQIVSADPTRQPRIWLPEPTDDDVEALGHGVQKALDLIAAPALSSVGATRPADVPESLEGLLPWVRAECYSLPHTVGTCAMGVSPDQGAVCDAAGRVHGIDGLYVVDASILPGPPTGFPHLVVLMMTHRLANALIGNGAGAP